MMMVTNASARKTYNIARSCKIHRASEALMYFYAERQSSYKGLDVTRRATRGLAEKQAMNLAAGLGSCLHA